jgi:omega-6 fatty acid desaturase (delta-12 desaturase)
MPPRAPRGAVSPAPTPSPADCAPRPAAPAAVRAHVAAWAVPNDFKAALWAASSIALYFACFALPWYLLPLHSLASMRLFVVCVHDTAHGALFSAPWANFLLGSLAAPLTGFTYHYWKWGHDFHHRHSNDLDFSQGSQTAPYTVAQFCAFPAWKQRLYRLFSVPAVLLAAGAPLSIVVAQPLSADSALDWALQLGWWVLLAARGCLARYLAVVLLVAPFGLVLFHTQHTFESCERSRGKTASGEGYYKNAMEGSSFLQVPRWLRFFTAGIEYHHIHHLHARVPCYSLQACHESVRIAGARMRRVFALL